MSMKDNNLPQDEERREDTLPVGEDAASEKAAQAAPSEAPEKSTEAANTPSGDVEEEIAGETEAFEEDSSEDSAGEEAEASDGKTDERAGGKGKKRKRGDSRRLRYGGMATGLTVVVVAVVVLFNVVAGVLNDRFPLNLDLTSEKLFTLTDESTEIAKGIQQDTQIVVFAAEKDFSNPSSGEDAYNKILREFYEATRQYGQLSDGKVTTSYVDLVESPNLATKYQQYEATSNDILFLSGTRSAKATVSDLMSYDEQSAYYYNKLTDVSSNVEKVLAAKLTMVTSENTPIITILTGHNEDSNTVSGVKSVAELNNYTTQELNITGSTDFNADSNLALIAAPSTDYSSDEIERLRKWLTNDGKYNRHLMVVLNYSASCPNLYEFLKVEYGLEVTDNLVFETDSNNVYQYTAYMTYGTVQSSDYTTDLSNGRVLTPLTRQILTNESSSTDNSLYNIDLLTFPESSRLVKLADVTNESSTTEPKQAKADEYPVIGMAYATKWGYDGDNNKYETNVVLCGSQLIFTQNYLSMNSVKNESLLVDTLNGISGNESTVSVSSKSIEKTSMEFSTGQANIFFLVFVVLVPAALIVLCLVVFIRRRRL